MGSRRSAFSKERQTFVEKLIGLTGNEGELEASYLRIVGPAEKKDAEADSTNVENRNEQSAN